jgi:hypothetical protein
MMFLVDSAGHALSHNRSASYPDPHEIFVREHQLIGADSAFAVLEVRHGTRFRMYRCDLNREADGGWRPQCRKKEEGLSVLPSNEGWGVGSESWTAPLKNLVVANIIAHVE